MRTLKAPLPAGGRWHPFAGVRHRLRSAGGGYLLQPLHRQVGMIIIPIKGGQGHRMTNRLKTYIVEDNETIRENLVATLEELTHAAVIGFSETESEAVAWFATHETGWNLAIVDLFLKQGSGLGVLCASAHRAKTQKVVVLSNYATPDIRRRCAELGVDAVFDKSNEIEGLLAFCANHDAALKACAGIQC